MITVTSARPSQVTWRTTSPQMVVVATITGRSSGSSATVVVVGGVSVVGAVVAGGVTVVADATVVTGAAVVAVPWSSPPQAVAANRKATELMANSR
jgi:tetrahydrodipicolinate N-succinyltransferase